MAAILAGIALPACPKTRREKKPFPSKRIALTSTSQQIQVIIAPAFETEWLLNTHICYDLLPDPAVRAREWTIQ